MPASDRDDASASGESLMSHRSRSANLLSGIGNRFRRKSRDSVFSSASTLVERSDSIERPWSRSKPAGDVLQVSDPTSNSASHVRKHSLSPPPANPTHKDTDHNIKPVNPLGLHAVYVPETPPSVDIIFVHGLGGTSQATWSWKRDTDFFWPGKWLPGEPFIRNARILSFGYDADFKSVRSGVVSSVSDFAKDLLFCMKFWRMEESGSLQIGEVVSL